MSRDHYKPVTDGLAVLVPSRNEKDTWVSYFSGSRWGTTAARPITIEDLQGPERLPEIFRRQELPLVVGVAEMRRAISKRDEPAFRQAFDRVRPWWPTVGKFTLGPIGDNWGGAQFLYSKLMNKLTQNARLILWQPENGLLMPALYCPDLKTAKFVMLVMGRLRVCPKCKGPFIPKADNQDYCVPAHGVAWRTAQSRLRKKQREQARKSRNRKAPIQKD